MSKKTKPMAHKMVPLNKRQKKDVKRIIAGQSEIKNLIYVQDTAIIWPGATGATASQYLYNISVLPQGTADNQRIGDKITLKQLDFRYQYHMQNQSVFGSEDQYNNLRIIVFRWHEDSVDKPPTVNDILRPSVLAVGNENYVTSPYNYDHQTAYHIIYDKCHTLTAMPVYTTALHYVNGPDSVYISQNCKFYGKRLGRNTMSYLDDTSNRIIGAIYVLMISDSQYPNHPDGYFQAVQRYTDL